MAVSRGVPQRVARSGASGVDRVRLRNDTIAVPDGRPASVVQRLAEHPGDVCRVQTTRASRRARTVPPASDLIGADEFEVKSPAVLRLCQVSGCSAYDCEYAALAEFLDLAFVNADRKLAKAFPGRARLLEAS